MKAKLAPFYLQEYPRLIRQINRLIAFAPGDPNLALLALFGSAARLTPGPSSDADLLILLHNERQFHDLTQIGTGIDLLQMAQDAPRGEWCAWPLSGVTGNAQASDLDEDFVSNVGQDGVLLYRQAGVTLPPALAGLTPYAVWLERVDRLLARCRRMVEAQAARAAS